MKYEQIININLKDVNEEFKKEFIAEHKSLYGKKPTDFEIVESWKANKDYFLNRQKNEKYSIN
jgi:hypothetical protein